MVSAHSAPNAAGEVAVPLSSVVVEIFSMKTSSIGLVTTGGILGKVQKSAAMKEGTLREFSVPQIMGFFTIFLFT